MDWWPKGLLVVVTVASPCPVAAWNSAELNGFVMEEEGGGGGGEGASWCVVVGPEGIRPSSGVSVPVADGTVAPAIAGEVSKKELVVVKVRQGLGVSRTSLLERNGGGGAEGRGGGGTEGGGGGGGGGGRTEEVGGGGGGGGGVGGAECKNVGGAVETG